MSNISKVLTANRLADGIAVWYSNSQGWVERVVDADSVSSKEDLALFEKVAAEAISAGQHCDVVLIDVEITEEGPRPLKLRERIRAEGPTIRLDLGNQAA